MARKSLYMETTEVDPQKTAGLLDKYMPQGDEEFLRGAWIACLQWAIGEPKVIEAFRAETGHQWTPAKCPIDKMVDDATGATEAFIVAFVEWFNVNIWGDLDEPMPWTPGIREAK